jgi:hypothetical protein
MTNYIKIKRTIEALQYCYPMQKIDKQTILKCLNDNNFLSIYVNY